VKKENGLAAMGAGKVELKLPPVEAFSFKGIMDEIKFGVAEDLERIAEICARSKYSLSNQYEVHMPPHGRGDSFTQTIGLGVTQQTHPPAGRTLQEHPSDDEQQRRSVRGAKAKRRGVGVAAQSTLETIMSSSRSSDEDKSKKKPAAVLAEEVRGRAAKHELEAQAAAADAALAVIDGEEAKPTVVRHIRSKSASFASMVIESANGPKHDFPSQPLSPTSLVSEPARPLTSIGLELSSPPILDEVAEVPEEEENVGEIGNRPQPTLIHNESRSSPLIPERETKLSIIESLNSWLPWNKPTTNIDSSSHGRVRSASNAEGSLRSLLKSADHDRKGKGVERHR
jgi:hypothetical protein